MYTGPLLVELLEQQHQSRYEDRGLFRQQTFTVQWRAKVGSFPHIDVETIVSAGEPCGAWTSSHQRKEDIRDRSSQLPLNGYIPGSAIRGIVRAWAKKRTDIAPKMLALLGSQDGGVITAGKIEFLDAWPQTPTQLTLDIVNPQEEFQVYHEGQGKPLPLYTLGSGQQLIDLSVAIRGIPGQATEAEVTEVWAWVQQALNEYGVGSRTASGYGALKSVNAPRRTHADGESIKLLDFTLYSQGCYGPNPRVLELRPSHWRGWLRSWALRFFLGVMSEQDARTTLHELFGTIEPQSCQGAVRLKILKGRDDQSWGDRSANSPDFYAWKGRLQITAPNALLEPIILPIIKFAASVGGVGRGWRRPLHIFLMKKKGHDYKQKLEREDPASRGTYLTLLHKTDSGVKRFAVAPDPQVWDKTYRAWRRAVKERWSDRYAPHQPQLQAEVFSPESCAVYLVPGPSQEPLDHENIRWRTVQPTATRGEGMELIYQPKYKRQSEVGGDAARGNAHCSWVSIKRIPDKQSGTKEVVCLFMGSESNLRSQFLVDLAQLPNATPLFGIQPPTS